MVSAPRLVIPHRESPPLIVQVAELGRRVLFIPLAHRPRCSDCVRVKLVHNAVKLPRVSLVTNQREFMTVIWFAGKFRIPDHGTT
jgi:hypothetical protein